MKIRLFTPLVLGASVFFNTNRIDASRNFVQEATNSTQTSTVSSILFDIQKEKLERLVKISEESITELPEGLAEFKQFYQDSLSYEALTSYLSTQTARKELVAAAKPKLEIIFQNSLKNLVSDNPQTQKQLKTA